MALKDSSLIEQLRPEDFDAQFGSLVACLKRCMSTGQLGAELDIFLERSLGIRRQPGEKCWEAAIGQVAVDAEWRKRATADSFRASLDKLQLAIRERRNRSNHGKAANGQGDSGEVSEVVRGDQAGGG